jgi:hypothetical protein
MTATASGPPTAQQPRPCCRLEDDGLRIAALKLLETSGYAALRHLRCEVTGAVVMVHGMAPSYFLKQMAQAVLQRLDGIRGVRNLVEVQVSEGVRDRDYEDAFPGVDPEAGARHPRLRP